MTDTIVTLTDAACDLWHRDFSIDQRNGPRLEGSPEWAIVKRTLQGGLSHGVDVVELDNGILRLAVLPTRGMGIWHGLCRAGRETIDLGWQSPVERPVHPACVHLAEHNGLGWLRGFNEWLCRCGLAWNGPPGLDVVEHEDGTRSETPLTLHGRIANTPAHRVDVSVSEAGPGTLRVRGVVDETMMFGPKLRLTSTVEMHAGSSRFRIIDEVQNLAGRPAEMQMLYHTNIGRPFLEAGSHFFAAIRELSPRDSAAARGLQNWQEYEAPTPGYAEQVFLLVPKADRRGDTLVLLANAARDRGLSLRFNTRELPYFSLWKCTQAEANGCVTGLEPATGFPNFKSFERERGRVIVLEPGQTWRATLEFAVHVGRDAVATAEHDIETLQGVVTMSVHATPQSRFSPAGKPG